jgi:hypothetical protein
MFVSVDVLSKTRLRDGATSAPQARVSRLECPVRPGVLGSV